MSGKLIIIGCGPKGLAIHVKAHVLKGLGWNVPEVVLIDRYAIAAHWKGGHGYTDGEQPLGTPPEKDVGFPYKSIFGKPVDQAMYKFSWSACLINTGKYDEWVDRGRRQPTHEQWASYLKWVAETSNANLKIGEISRINRSESAWSVEYPSAEDPLTMESEQGDTLVITGPGEPKQLPRQFNAPPKVLDGQNFWNHLPIFRNFRDGNIAVIGGGETAASIVVALIGLVDKKTVRIDLINRHGAVFTRGESYDENRHFSDPADWPLLSEPHRAEIIKRTDRGVFSRSTKEIIDNTDIVKPRIGEVTSIMAFGSDIHVFLDGCKERVPYKHVIVALGFDYLSFTKFLSHDLGLSDHREVEKRITTDLSVQGISPKLHIPMAAGLAQGPGFPNLSCLGLLSDRILQPYCTPPDGAIREGGHQ